MAVAAGAIFADWQAYGYGIRAIVGSFAPNGGSAISNASNKGRGFSVARTNTGLYTVTMNAGLNFVAMLSGLVTIQISAATSVGPQMRAVDVTTARTVQIANSPAGADTDIAANASNRVHFCFFMATSDLNK
jgi:hypothetical protein